MSTLFTPTEKRTQKKKVLGFIAVAVGFWLLAKMTAGAPGVGAILTAAALAGLTVMVTRYDAAVQAGPDRGRVLSADITLGLAAVFGLAAAGKAGVLGPAAVAPVVLGILAVAAHRLAADGSRVAALVSAYRIAWRTRRTDAVVALTAGLTLGTGIALTGMTVGGILAALVLLAPAARCYKAARAEQSLRGAVEAALAGAFSGGPEWTPVRANAGRAPIRRFSGDEYGPVEIVLPLPPTSAASAQATQADECTARLAPWGLYAVSHSTGRDRTATVKRVPPLPTSLVYDGRPAVGRKVWLGKGQVNREMVETQPHLTVGDQYDVEIDYALMPHTLIVGGTGAGKSIAMNLIAAQWLRGGNRLVVLDPKRVGFTRLRDKAGVLTVAVDVEDIADVMGRMRAEMMARYAVLEARKLDNVYDLPPEEQPPAVLIIFDEASEALGQDKVGKDDAEGQAANAAKARIAADLNSIVRLGRAAAVHCLVGAQRADATDVSGQTKAQLEGRILLGVADQTARGMAGFGSTAVSATPGVRGRGIIGKVNTAPTETQIAYCSVQDLDRWLPAAGDHVVDVSADASVVGRFEAADGEADRLAVLRDAVDAGVLTDEDTKACGYQNVAAVEAVLADWRARIDAPEPVIVVPPPVIATPRAATVTKPGPDGTATQAPGPGGDPALVAGRPGFTLDSVGGYETVKAQLLDTVGTALADSEGAAAYGIQTGGVLLYGPPGTGKTHIAEALAGTLGVNWLKVSVSDLTSQWVGEGARKIEAAVDSALAASPCILLIDEIDAIAGRRDDETSGEGRKGVNALLVQLDRLKASPGVVVLATTNDLSRLDPAVIRDGRFDARVRIDLPDEAARVSILRTVLAGRPADPTLDVDDVAARTGGYTAAMLTALINAAARSALADRRTIVTEDVLGAIAARGGQDRPTVEQAGLDGLVLTDDTDKDLREVLAMLGDPDRARRYGITPPTGLLLAGPPGTGKTSIAKALAAEAKTSFYAVSPGEWTSKYQGEAERKVREVFERARANAPSIIFIDEIDAIGAARGDDSSGSSRILTTLLAEMDGFGSKAAGGASVFVIAATNRPDVLDTALTRPGRLSRTVVVGLPDLAGRVALLARLTADVPLGDDVDLAALAEATDGMSPADLGGLVQMAAMVALRSADPDGEPVVDAAAFATALPATEPDGSEDADGAAWLASLLDDEDPAKV